MTIQLRTATSLMARRNRFAMAGLLMSALALTGCTSEQAFSVIGLGGSSTEEGGTASRPCPSVAILNETDHVTVFNGRGNDLTDVVLRAETGKVVTQCTYNLTDSTISLDIAFDGLAELGPAASSRVQTVTTYVAVMRRFGKRVKKQVYEVPLVFDGNTRRIQFLKTVDGTVVPYGGDADGRIYEILVGFQLTPEQLAYNRRVPRVPIR